jgi:DNA polymerase I-like protein with 3'-5' exonuclease and polymerase domains
MPRLKRMKLTELAADSYARWNRDRPDVIALDTETEGVAFYDRPFCVTATWQDDVGNLEHGYWELDSEEACSQVRLILGNSNIWIFHNAKFDLQKFLLEDLCDRERLNEVTIHDTEAIFHLIDNVDRKGLKYLAAKHLKDEGLREPEKALAKVRRKLGIKKADGYLYLPREYVVRYAMADTDLTYRLFEYGWPLLPESLRPLYREEQKLCLVLLDMESAGMGLDVEYTRRKQSEYGQLAMSSLAAIRKLSGNPELNPASPKQLKDAFAERGLDLDSTDEDHLLPLDDDLAKCVLEYRRIAKLHKTYFTGLMNEQRDGIVHPNFRQHGARTGRMSSGKAAE